jgi:hypothetical protein
LQESLRWWDHWLKGIDTGIMDEPMLRCWLQDAVYPAVSYAERPGRWIAEPSWPSPYVQEKIYFLNDRTLDQSPGETAELSITGLQHHGLNSGGWGGHGSPGEYPGDQRGADGESLTFTSRPLSEPMNLLGRPEVRLSFKADQPLAIAAVRLCDVAPDGRSTLVTWGLLNLTHYQNHEASIPLIPGQTYTVTIPLNLMAYRIPAGHCWRVSVSPTHMRHAWPSPNPVTLTLLTGESSTLTLPERPIQLTDDELTPFPPAEIAPPEPIEKLRPGARRQTIEQDVVNGTTTFTLYQDSGRIRYSNHGLELDDISTQTLFVQYNDPLSMKQTITSRLEYKRADWGVIMETESELTADANYFYLANTLIAYEGQEPVFRKRWTKKIDRNGV